MELLVWLAKAKPGDRFTYHQGFIARERDISPHVKAVANAAMFAWEQGKVYLVQRRKMLGNYDYIAIAKAV